MWFDALGVVGFCFILGFSGFFRGNGTMGSVQATALGFMSDYNQLLPLL